MSSTTILVVSEWEMGVTILHMLNNLYYITALI